MLTRNFVSLMTKECLNIGSTPTNIDINGNNVNNTFAYLKQNNWDYNKFVLGTGTTKPKPDDYKLESVIEEGYKCSTLIKRYETGSEKDMASIYGTILNTSDEPITFTEVGLIMYGVSDKTIGTLFAREVYDTPITIEPGDVAVVSVNFM